MTRPRAHDGDDVGDTEHGASELLDNEDRHAVSRDLGHHPVQLLDHDRRQPDRELVEEQDRGLGRQRPRHGEHLLLAT